METKVHRTDWMLSKRVGFTLVELLVVIAIIGILASLITAAAAGALKRARQAQIKTEVDQIHMALQTYQDNNGSFPPNCQVDDTDATPGSNATNDQIDESIVLSDLRTHFKRAFPQSRESDDLLRALVGLDPVLASTPVQRTLPGGMTAGEAVVFWLGGFSPDPQFPISGEGGPSYSIRPADLGGVDPNQADPIESRNWVYPFEVARLRPRDAVGYFPPGTDQRYIEFTDNNGILRRINFWQYVPPRMTQPFLYFDTSRHAPADLVGGTLLPRSDPPAATGLSGAELHVHAIKRRSESANASSPIQFATPDKFQILAAGVDDVWGEDAFEQMSLHETAPADIVVFPDGPFTGDVADTIVNFSEATLEASQP